MATAVHAESPTDTLDVKSIIQRVSASYNVKSEVIERVMACESNFNTNAEGDFKNGEPQSFGLSQIHLPSHPNITKEQATDPYFATMFMAENISKGRGSMWTCWRRLYQ